jgi:hypothetical protein
VTVKSIRLSANTCRVHGFVLFVVPKKGGYKAQRVSKYNYPYTYKKGGTRFCILNPNVSKLLEEYSERSITTLQVTYIHTDTTRQMYAG